MAKLENDLKQEWFSSFMRPDNTIVIKINDETYSSHLANISNIQFIDGQKEPVFDVQYDDDKLYDDEKYNRLICLAVGQIIINAVAQQESAIKNSVNSVADLYFKNIFDSYNLKFNTNLSSSQLLKMNKLYPIPLPDSEDVFPEDESSVQAYFDNISPSSDFSVFDLDDNNKEYNMTNQENKVAFIELCKSRLEQYLAKE